MKNTSLGTKKQEKNTSKIFNSRDVLPTLSENARAQEGGWEGKGDVRPKLRVPVFVEGRVCSGHVSGRGGSRFKLGWCCTPQALSSANHNRERASQARKDRRKRELRHDLCYCTS